MIEGSAHCRASNEGPSGHIVSHPLRADGFLREGHGGRDFSWKLGRSFFLWFLSRRGLLLMRRGRVYPSPRCGCRVL